MQISDFGFRISDLASAFAEVIVIHYIIASKNPIYWHSKFNQVLDVPLAANERGRVQPDDPPLDRLLPPGTRFILARALRHDDHRYPAAHTGFRGNERSKIIPAVNRHHIRIRLL